MISKSQILIILAVCIFSIKSLAQTCTATGAQINLQAQVVKNIKTDFGAVGNGVTDDHQAFVNAAAFINSQNGNIRLLIPDGIYIVGKQTAHLNNTATYNDPVYEGEVVMDLQNVNNVSIIGSNNSIIVFKNALHYGTFDLNTGLPPANLNLYNPSCSPPIPNGCPGIMDPQSPCTTGINACVDYKYAGTIGSFLSIQQSNSIEIKNLEINGNNENYILGGNWGLGDRPIEISNSHGIDIWNSKFITLGSLKVHHFGLDNIKIEGGFVNSDTSQPKTTNIIIDSVFCEYAGRNCFSWVGGTNFCITNSSFNHAGQTTIKTKPAYGMDIEPERQLNESEPALCSSGYFENCNFKENYSLGFTTGASDDSPIPELRAGSASANPPYVFNRFSYNHYFKNCLVVGTTSDAIHNFINRVTFEGCKFYGGVLQRGSSLNISTPPTAFNNCLFSDCYNGKLPSQVFTTFTMEYGHKTIIDNCKFERLNPIIPFPTDQSRIIFIEPNITCADDDNKPIIRNSIFEYLTPPASTQIFASILRKTRLLNNQFYKDPSSNIGWWDPVGCGPNGEGNVDLGNGLQKFTWPPGFVYPNCATKLVCQDNLFISEDETVAQNHQTSNYIISDAKLITNNQNSSFKAANYIHLNAGFEATVSGTAQLEMSIESCTLPPPSNMQEQSEVFTAENTEIINNGFKIYPNPFNDVITIQLDSKTDKKLIYYEIINFLGQVASKVAFNSNVSSHFTIIPKVPPGNYFIKLFFNDGVVVKKIVKL
jgi:hypothetical protein